MQINLAKSAGFCFGVRRALNIAFETANSAAEVYMLGDIVHNEDVVRQINAAGIKKIIRLAPTKDKTLLIPAHGASLCTLKQACLLGYKIVDATCPMVKEIHKIAKSMEEKGYRIIVIGDKKHAEVRGISGQLKTGTIVIDSLKHIAFKKISGIKKAAVIVQSTQDLEKVKEIVRSLKPKIKGLEFFNTICQPTRAKQEEIKKIALENEVMVIIGSKTSANTKRLYEISRSLNKNSHWIQSGKDIRKGWFKGIKTVGITAGASTPDAATKEVVEYIKQVR